MRKAVVIGISHTRAMRRALEGRQSRVDFDLSWLVGKPQEGRIERGDTTDGVAAEKIGALTPTDGAFFHWMGSMHHQYGTFCGDNPFRVIGMGDAPHADEPPIMASLLLALFRGHMENRGRLRRFMAAARCPVWHLATPPPIEDNERITQRLERHLRGGKTVRPAHTRLAVWQLEMMALQEVCAEIAIPFVPPPAQAVLPSGFLDPAYVGDDTLHANGAYGELVLQQIETLLLLGGDAS